MEMRVPRTLGPMVAILAVLLATVPATATTFPGTNGRIAWTRDGDIFTARADGSAKRRITESPRWEHAAWSPDGSRLAIARERATMKQRAQIMVVAVRGSVDPITLRTRFSVQHLSWSPDGSRIAYCDLDINDPDARSPYPSAIKVVDVATGTQSRLTEYADSACQPSWSPDGSRIAFGMSDATDNDLYVMDADGSNVRAVTDDDASQFDPIWSPTGDTIAFVRVVPHANGQGDKETVVETISADGTGLITLTEPLNAFDRSPSWAPDGTRLLFFRRDASGTELGVVNADGSGVQLVAEVEGGSAAWSPDSSKILLSRDGDLFVIGADGTGETRIVGRPSVRDAQPSWQSR